MKILLFGKHGQLGWELWRSLLPLGEVIALGREDTPAADFMRPDEIATTVRTLSTDIIVNAAAFTAVVLAEFAVLNAELINIVTPGALADAAADIKAWLIHYSTDYVFDGTGERPWTESDNCKPLNIYGRTKLIGENNIRES